MPYTLQPRTIRQKFSDYCKKCDAHTVTVRYRDQLIEVPKPKIYCFEAFCCSIGIGEDTLKEYEDNKNYKATFKDIRFAVLARKLEALVNGEGSASGLIFDLKANYGIYAKKPVREPNEAVEVTLNLGGGCGDNLTGGGGASNDTPGVATGEAEEHGLAGMAEDGTPVTAGLQTGDVAGETPACVEVTQPPPAPLRPGIDYPISLNKQPASPVQSVPPEAGGYKGYESYAAYWARHCIF